jgi:hypothetical protein
MDAVGQIQNRREKEAPMKSLQRFSTKALQLEIKRRRAAAKPKYAIKISWWDEYGYYCTMTKRTQSYDHAKDIFEDSINGLMKTNVELRSPSGKVMKRSKDYS